MKEFILFMYDDAVDRAVVSDEETWNSYLSSLRASGRFDGGSSIGSGTRYKKSHAEVASQRGLNGFIRVRAEGMVEAAAFLSGNPVYEAGGTFEVRELLRDEEQA